MRQLYLWTAKVIESCTTEEHIEAVDRLIQFYFEKTKDEETTKSLKEYRDHHLFNVHKGLKIV